MDYLFKFLDLIAEGAPAVPLPAPPTEILPSYEGTFLKMFLTLLALIVGLFFTVWMLKRLSLGRWARGNSNRSIKVTEKRALSPKTVLYLVEVDGKEVLIAESHLEVKKLMTLDRIIGEKEE